MALPPTGQLRWGPGLENIIDFGWPKHWDGLKAWRRPAPGSEKIEATVPSSWITGYWYMMRGIARWFSMAYYHGPTGLQAFIDWAGRGNAVRWVPDSTMPWMYVDGCYLVSPFSADEAEPDLESADGSQSISLVLRHPSIDLGLVMRGLIWEYTPGASLTDPLAYNFDRSDGGVATYPNVDGVFAAAAADILRDRAYFNGQRVTLIEPGLTNKLTVDSDGLTGWSAVNTPVVGTSIVLGTVTLNHVSDNDGAASEYHQKNFSGGTLFTGNGYKSICVVMFTPDTPPAGGNRIQVHDTTAAGDRLFAVITWPSGVPSVNAATGQFLGAVKLMPYKGLNVWAIFLQTTSVTAANAHDVRMIPCTQPTEQGDIYWGRLGIFDHPVPLWTALKTVNGGGTVAQDNDDLNQPVSWPSLDKVTMSFRILRPNWADRASWGGIPEHTPYLVTIGNGASQANTIGAFLRCSNKQIQAEINDGGGNNKQSGGVAIPSGDVIDITAQFENMMYTNFPICRVSVNGGAFGSDSPAGSPFNVAFSKLQLGDALWSLGNAAGNAFIMGRVAWGKRTHAEMMAL